MAEREPPLSRTRTAADLAGLAAAALPTGAVDCDARGFAVLLAAIQGARPGWSTERVREAAIALRARARVPA